MNIKTLLLISLLTGYFPAAQADLNVGVLNFDPPYVYSTSGGFDIDLTKAICTILHTKCNLIPMDYHDFFGALDQGNIDFALGGIFIQPGSDYIFSLPYMVGLGQFITLSSSPYNAVDDLKGSVVGAIAENPTGVVFVDFLNKNYPGEFEIHYFNNVNDLVNALQNKTITAAYMRHSSVHYWTQNSSLFKALGPINTVGAIAVMSAPKKTDLIQRINSALMQMESNGSYINLYNIYFGSN